MSNNASTPLTSLAFAIFFFLYLSLSFHSQALSDNKHAFRPLVKKDQWKSIVISEYGEISAINIPDEIKRDTYHIQFLTLEPNSLFLPAILNADMVFYIHTGSGRLSWVDKDEEKIKRVALRRGDIYRLQPGSVFQIQSNLENERQKLRIYAIFTNTDNNFNLDPSVRAYSCIADLVRGFDSKTLQAAFKVSEEVIEAIKNSTARQMIVHTMSKTNDDEETKMELESPFLKAFIHNKKKKKKTDAYNILDEDPDFKNSNGWSTTVTKKTSHLLKGSNVGVFMVNLTKGSMMGPHWNPKATEIAIVLQGQGMITIVSSNITENMRFKVSEGDVFKISRFHPMAQISFNNETFVFMGISTSTKKNHPQFLAGKSSVLQTLDNDVLAMSFGVNDSTIDRLLASQVESVILECNSCAEEMERKMEEEIEKERKEEERKRQEEEEEKRKREEEEEEEEKRKREEEEARKKQDEEQRKREEEEARQRQEDKKEEEARKKQEEEQRKREEEEARQRQEDEKEEEARKKQEEEQRKKEEEEARQRQEDEKEEEARKKQEEEQRKKEEEEARQRQEEEEEQRRREEEEARKREERQKQEEEWKSKEEERERRKQQQEERRKGKEEEESEQEKARRQAKERERKRKEYDEEEQKEWDEGRRSEEYADEGKYLKLKSHLEDNYMNVN